VRGREQWLVTLGLAVVICCGTAAGKAFRVSTARLPTPEVPYLADATPARGVTRALLPGWTIEVDRRDTLIAHEGPDFSVYRVVPPAPSEGYLGLYVGGHPSADGDLTHRGRALGRPAFLHDALEEGVHERDAIVSIDGGAWHLFFGSSDPVEFERLESIAASIREGVPRQTLVPCGSAAPATPDGPSPTNADARRLALSETFAVDLGASARKLWQRLVARADAESLFRSIVHAEDATLEGRLYGLAGLYAVGAADADALACATRAALPAGAEVRRAGRCSVGSTSARDLFERQDGLRLEPHWGERERLQSLVHAVPDLRGGGLPVALSQPVGRGGVWADGYLEEVIAPQLADLLRDQPRENTDLGGPRERWIQTSGDLCWVGVEGRVRCVVHEVPPSVRAPTALEFMGDSFGCALGAQGERVCFLRPGFHLRLLAHRCGRDEPDFMVERATDGPWASLAPAQSSMLCAIHAESAALTCFRAPGRIVGELHAGRVSDASHPFVITDEGRLLRQEDEAWLEMPLPERAVEIASSFDGVAVRLMSGRVLLSPGTSWVDGVSVEDEGWTELPRIDGHALTWSGDTLCGLGDTARCFDVRYRPQPIPERRAGEHAALVDHIGAVSLCAASAPGVARCWDISGTNFARHALEFDLR
jgi:hypothetical protein